MNKGWGGEEGFILSARSISWKMIHKLRKCSCDNLLNTFQQGKHVLGHFSLLFILLEWPSFSMTDWKQALNLSTFSTTHGKTSLRSPSRELFLTSCSSFSVCLSLQEPRPEEYVWNYTCMDKSCICHVQLNLNMVQRRFVSASTKEDDTFDRQMPSLLQEQALPNLRKRAMTSGSSGNRDSGV